jgi:hypothetical protein
LFRSSFLKGAFFLVGAGLTAMWRFVFVSVALFAAIDRYMLDGHYTFALMQMLSSILHFFRVT